MKIYKLITFKAKFGGEIALPEREGRTTEGGGRVFRFNFLLTINLGIKPLSQLR